MNKLELFLKELRSANQNVMEPLFLQGQCHYLYHIVAVVFPGVECYSNSDSDHILIKWKGDFYDILGKLSKERLEQQKPIPIDPEQLSDGDDPRVLVNREDVTFEQVENCYNMRDDPDITNWIPKWYMNTFFPEVSVVSKEDLCHNTLEQSSSGIQL